jgi:peptide/nickel transport system permease protein
MADVARTAIAVRDRSPRQSDSIRFLVRLFRDKPLGAAGFVICLIFLF